MSFLYPEFLYLMLLPAGLLVYLISTNKDTLERIFEPETLKRLRISGDGLGRTGHNVLIFIAFFFMTLALAQPVIKKDKKIVEVNGTDIVIAIDLSSSMQARDFLPNRFIFAKQKIQKILPKLPIEKVAIIGFASVSFLVALPTTDKETLVFLLEHLDHKTVASKGTDLLSAIKESIKLLKKSKSKTLLLVTDGGDGQNLEPIINLLKKESIRPIIWMITAKKEASFPISKADEKLKRITNECDGLYMEATISQEDEKLIKNYLEKISNLSKMDKKVIDEKNQLFYYPLALALLILLFGIYSIGRGNQSMLLLFFILFYYQKVDAGIFDFQLIKDANKAYEEGDYKKSVECFKKLSINNNRGEIWFNLGNSYYKSKRYKMALSAYFKVITKDLEIERAKLYNIANCYVKLGELKKATLFYQKALKLKDDKDTKFNLALVLKALQQKKQNRDKSSNLSKTTSLKKRSKTKKRLMQLTQNRSLKLKLYPLIPPEDKNKNAYKNRH